MKSTEKLLKLTVILLIALMAMPGIAAAKNTRGTMEAKVENAVQKNTEQEVCRISGNDCEEVVGLFYEIDRRTGYDYNYEKKKGKVKEPYVSRLKKMNITVKDVSDDPIYRGGENTTFILKDGTRVNFFSEGLLSNTEITVTLPDGRKFSFSESKIYEMVVKNLKIGENDVEEVVDLLYEIFEIRGAYTYDDKNHKSKVLEPYASQLKKKHIPVTKVYISNYENGAKSTYIELGSDYVEFFKNSKGKYENPKAKVGNFYLTFSLPEVK